MKDRPLISDNAVTSLKILLRRLRLPHSEVTIDKFRQHPYFPSLLAYSDTLNSLKVENTAAHLEYHDLYDTDLLPLVVHLKDNGGTYLVVDSADDEGITILNETGGTERQDKSSFLLSWTGIALLIQASESSREDEIWKNRLFKSLQSIGGVALVVSLLLMVSLRAYYDEMSYVDLAQFVIALIGLSITTYLVRSQYGEAENGYTKLCASLGANSTKECSKLLGSKDANIFRSYTYSDLGFVYYAIMCLYLITGPYQGKEQVLSVVTGVVALFPLYSIYKQYSLNTWCRICLLVQFLIAAQFAISLYYYGLGYVNSAYFDEVYPSLLWFLGVFLLVSGFYMLIKPSLDDYNNLQRNNSRYRPIVFDPATFENWHSHNPILSTFDLGVITSGNPMAENTLLVVTNPECQICIEDKEILEDIIAHRNNTKIETVFLTSSDVNDPANIRARDEIKLHYSPSLEMAGVKAGRNPESESMDIPAAQDILDLHRKWCLDHHIFETPRYIYNGKMLSPNYHLNDLYYLLE